MLELLEPPIDGDLATFDLVDGFRVERNMSNVANVMSFRIGALLEALLGGHNAGFVATEAIFRLKPGGKPRRPDVAYVAADRFDLRTATEKDPWDAVPNLAVEVISPSNTVAEIEEKLEEYFRAGVKTVIVAAPVKAGALNVVMGVNDHLYDPGRHRLLTAGSCTTNCLAPVVKVMHETLGIRHGVITTIHDITNTQVVVDAPHKDLRRARASSLSLIPTSTGSATAITLIYPELKGRLTGVAVRVPLLNASLTDCVFEVQRATSVEEVNAAFKSAAAGPLKGILGYEERPLVSVDFKDDPRSAIVDALSTMVVDETCVKVLAWYDNEIGYVNRMIELAQKVGASM